VNGWVASSYHIKVAVRDDEAAWLSSGNWQSSNQPPADPLAPVCFFGAMLLLRLRNRCVVLVTGDQARNGSVLLARRVCDMIRSIDR